MYEDKSTKEKIFDLLGHLANETSPSHGKGYVDQIKKLIEELSRTTYKAKGKLDWQAALNFLEFVRDGIGSLEEDIRLTPNVMEMDEIRKSKFQALAGELTQMQLKVGHFKLIIAKYL